MGWQDDPIVSGGGAATMPQPAGNSWEDDPIVAPAPQTFKSHMLPPPTGESRGPGLQLPAPQSAIQPFERDAMVRHFTENPGSESSYVPISEQDLTPGLRNAYDANVKAWNDQAGGNEPIPGVVTDTPTQNYTPNPYIWKLPNGGYMIQKAAAANIYNRSLDTMRANPVQGAEQGVQTQEQLGQIDRNRQIIAEGGNGYTPGLRQVAEESRSLAPQDRQEIADTKAAFQGRPRAANTFGEDMVNAPANVWGGTKRVVGGVAAGLHSLGENVFNISPGDRSASAGEDLIESGSRDIANNPIDTPGGKLVTMAPGIAAAVASGGAGAAGLFAFGAVQGYGNAWANTFEEEKRRSGNVEQARSAANKVAPISGIVGGIMQTLRLPMGSPAASAVENVVQNVLIHTTNGAAIGAVQSWADQLAQQAVTGRPIDEKSIFESAAQNGLISGTIRVAHMAIGGAAEAIRQPAGQVRGEQLSESMRSGGIQLAPPEARPTEPIKESYSFIGHQMKPGETITHDGKGGFRVVDETGYEVASGKIGGRNPPPAHTYTEPVAEPERSSKTVVSRDVTSDSRQTNDREPVQPPQPPERANQGRETAAETGKPFVATAHRGVQTGDARAVGENGAFYSPDPAVSEGYAGKSGQVITDNVEFKNPLVSDNWMTAKQELGLPQSATMPELTRAAADAGHDGIVFNRHNGNQEHVKLPKPAPETITGPDEGKASEMPSERGREASPGAGTFRETNAKELAGILRGGLKNNSGVTQEPRYFSNTPELALGQGENQGVRMEFDPAKIIGTPDMSKPAAGFMAEQGKAELVGKYTDRQLLDGLRAVTIPKSVMDAGEPGMPWQKTTEQHIAGELNKMGWTRTENADGTITFRKPAPRDAVLKGRENESGNANRLDDSRASGGMGQRPSGDIGEGAGSELPPVDSSEVQSPKTQAKKDAPLKSAGKAKAPKPKDAALKAKASESAAPPVSAKEPPAPTVKESLTVADKPVGESPKPPANETSAEKKARIAALTDAELAKAMRNPKPGESSLLIGEQSKRERANEPSKLDAIQENLEGRLKDVQDAKARRAASNRDKGKRSGMAQGIDPQELLLKGMISGVKIVRKVKDFAAWSAEMIKEMGSDISEHLAAIWSHIAPNSEDRIASVANAELDLDRIVRGLSPMDDVATRPRQRALDEARAKIRDNPNSAIELVESLTRTPRGLTDTDVMMLVHRKAELQNAWQKNHEYGETAQEAGNAENATDAAHNEYFLNTQLDQLDKVIGKGEGSSSTATARALSAMNSQLNEERYTTANIEQRARAANLYEPLNEGERKQLDDLRKKHDAAQRADADGKSGEGSGRANGEHEQAKSDAGDEAAGERKQGVKRNTKKTIESLTAGLKDAAKDGPPSNLADWIKDIHRAVIRDGFTERDAAIDKVHEIVSGILPGMTRRQVMDAMIHSPYKELSKDEIEVQRRAHNGEILQLTRIDDALNKHKLGDRRGIEQAPLTDEGRKLKREYDELVKKLDLRPSDPEKQLKSALDSMKTRIRNRIADIQRQLAYGAKDNFERGGVKPDAEALAMKKELAGHQEILDAVFESETAKAEGAREEELRRQISELNSQLAGETAKAKAEGKADTKSPVIKDLEARRDALMQERYDSQDARLERATKAARAEAARWQERHDHARLGEFENGRARTDVVSSEEIDALKAWSKAAAAEVKMLDQAASVRKEQARIEAKQKKVDQLRERLQTGDLSVRGRKPTVEAKDYVAAANEVARLNKEIAAARRDSPDGIQAELWRRRANVERQIAEGQERLRTGDFTKKPRRTPAVETDPDARQRQADLNEVRKNIDRAIEAIRLKNRTKFEKAMDLTVKWKRAAVLSWPTTFMKLTAAAGEGMVFAPADEVSGMIWHKLFPNVSAQAPREGGGLSLKAEMKAIGSFGQSLRDSWKVVTGKEAGTKRDSVIGAVKRTLKTAMAGGTESQLDARHGDMRDMPRSFLDYAGVLHGAFKNPLKWNEYTRSVEKRLSRADKLGEDITDPIVQMRHMAEAYKDAKRSIFMQDNRVVDAVKWAFKALEQKSQSSGKVPVLGKLAGTLARSELPILRIPTNLVAATFERMFGTFAGLTEIGVRKAFGDGLKNLHPDEADAIMRHLKKGSLGAAGLLAGFFMPGSVGGYGKRTDDKDIDEGSLKVFGIEIPKLLLHNPLMETLQIGATIRRVMDSKLHKHDKEVAGFSNGMKAAALGLLRETPIVRELNDVSNWFDPNAKNSPEHLAARNVSTFVPGLAQWTAQKFDQDPKAKEMFGIPGTRKATSRAPETAVDEVKKTIPGLRNQVPPAANTENLKHLHTAYKKLLELGDEAGAAEMMQRMQDEAKNPTGEDPMKAQKEKVKAEHEAQKKPVDIENERKQGIEKVKRDYQLRSERIKGNNLLQSQP